MDPSSSRRGGCTGRSRRCFATVLIPHMMWEKELAGSHWCTWFSSMAISAIAAELLNLRFCTLGPAGLLHVRARYLWILQYVPPSWTLCTTPYEPRCIPWREYLRDDHAGRVDDMVPCSTQQYGMLWHGVWFGMAWYGMLYVVWYGMVWYGAVWCHGIYIYLLKVRIYQVAVPLLSWTLSLYARYEPWYIRPCIV